MVLRQKLKIEHEKDYGLFSVRRQGLIPVLSIVSTRKILLISVMCFS